MRYRLRYSEEFRSALRTLPGNYRQRVRRLSESLADTPRPPEAEALRGEATANTYKVRLDRWRLIYQVDDENQTIYVLAVRRKTGPETYQNLGC